MPAPHTRKIRWPRRAMGSRKTDEKGDPAAQKSEKRMIEFGQEGVFAARLGEWPRPILRRPALRRRAIMPPTAQRPRRTIGVAKVLHEEAGSREDPGPDHIGHDDTGQGEKAQLPFQTVRFRESFFFNDLSAGCGYPLRFSEWTSPRSERRLPHAASESSSSALIFPAPCGL